MEDDEVLNIFRVIGMMIPEEEKENKEVVKINFGLNDFVKIPWRRFCRS